jgi:transcriptional regulator with XRE-family HTH domain
LNHSINSEAFATLIKEARTRKRMTVAEVADQIGVHFSRVWQWEHGQATKLPSPDVLNRLFGALQLDPNDVYETAGYIVIRPYKEGYRGQYQHRVFATIAEWELAHPLVKNGKAKTTAR